MSKFKVGDEVLVPGKVTNIYNDETVGVQIADSEAWACVEELDVIDARDLDVEPALNDGGHFVLVEENGKKFWRGRTGPDDKDVTILEGPLELGPEQWPVGTRVTAEVP